MGYLFHFKRFQAVSITVLTSVILGACSPRIIEPDLTPEEILNTGPGSLTFVSVTPLSPHSSQTPTVKGTSNRPLQTVKLYTDSSCSTEVASGTYATFSGAGLSTSALASNSTHTIYGRGFIAGLPATHCNLLTTYVQDSVNPTVAITSPAVSAYANLANVSAWTLSGTCSENGRNVVISGATSATTTCAGGAWSVNLNLNALAQGAFVLNADHSDAAGNTATQASRGFIKDTVAPTVAWTAPAANSYVNPSNVSAFAISGTCDEEGRTVVIGGAMAGSATCTAGAWSTNLNLTALTDGSFSLDATLTDAAGNTSSTASRSFIKDTSLPSVAFLTPASNTLVGSAGVSSFTVTGSCSENGRNVVISGAVSATVSCSAGAWTASLDVSGVAEGAFTLYADHNNVAGTSAPQASRSFIKDTTAPTVAISTPAANAYINGTNVAAYAVTGTCSENTRNVVITGSAAATVSCTGGAWSANLDFSAAAEGVVSIQVNHSDAAGNAAPQASRNFNKDTVSPVVAITAPAANTYVTPANVNPFTLSGTCSENGQTVSISGAATGSTSCAAGAWSVNLNLTGVADGNFTLTADLSDVAGNAASSSSRIFIKDTDLPTVAFTSPAANSYINSINMAAFTVNGTCSENGRNVAISGAVSSSATCTTGTWSVTLDLSAVADGVVTLYADHSDTGGNNAAQASRSFNKVSAPGGANSISIAGGASHTNSATVSLTLHSDNYTSQMYITNTAGCASGGSWEPYNTTKAGWALGQTNGTATVFVRYLDLAGNLSACVSDTIVHDSIAPTVAIMSPAANSYVTAANVTSFAISGTCSEDGQNVNISGAITASTSCSSGTWSTNLNMTAVADGAFTLNINHSDLAGNAATQDSRSFNKDVGVPVVAITSPAANSYANLANVASFTISGTCSENGRDVVLSGAASATMTCSGGTWSTNLDLSALAQGAFTINANHSDLAGNAATQSSRGFIKDTLAPTVAITSPAANSIISAGNQSSFAVSGTCSENGQNVVISGNASGSVACAGGTWSLNLDFSAAADGTVTINANHSDLAGNAATQDSRNFLKDATPPAVAITSPAVASYINAASVSSFAVSGTCSENGQNVVISGSASGSVACAGGTWSINLNFTAAAQGTVTIFADHSDSGSNPAPQASRAFNKDTVLPVISALSPTTGPFAGGQSVNFSWNATDLNLGASPVVLQWSTDNFATHTVFASGLDFDGPYNATIPSLDTSTFKVRAVASDLAGNSSTDTTPNIVVDSTIPTVAISAPAANSYITPGNVASFAVNGTCSENTRNVVISGDASATVACSAGAWSANLNFSAAAEGNVTINVNHSDAAGNNATQATRTFIKDTLLPAVAFSSPAVNSFVTTANMASFALTGSCTENGRDVVISGAGSATVTCTGGAWSANVNLSAAAEGTLTLYADHSDAGSNAAPQASRTFIKDTVVPTVAVSAPAANSYVTSGNMASFAVNGTCSENTRNVVISGDASATVACSAGAWSANLNFSAAAEGNVTINVNHSDAAGNNATQATRTFIKDTSSPTVAISAPAANSYVNAANVASFAVNGTCSENTRDVVISGDASATVTCSAGAWSANLNFTAAAQGNVTINVNHSDAAGNNATQATRTFIKDTALPTVAISSPAANSYVTSANVSSFAVVGSCSENGRNVVISGDASATVSCIGGGWTANLDFASAAQGNVTINVNHSDAAGNNATQATRTFIKDSSLPTVAITSPSAGSYANLANQSSFAVNGTCSENGRNVVVTAGGGVESSTVSCSAGAWSTNLNFSGEWVNASIPGTANLISYWKANNNWNDSKGTHHGTTQNGATFTSSSKVGTHAGQFDGVDDYVSVPQHASFSPANQNASLSFWFKAPNTNQVGAIYSARNGTIFGVGVAATDTFNWTAGKRINILLYQDGSNYRGGYSTADVVDGNWHHIAVVSEPGADQLYLFVDGAWVGLTMDRVAGSYPNLNSSDIVNIGRDVDLGLPFNGQIDEVMFWKNHRLTSGEVTALYNRGLNNGIPDGAVTVLANHSDAAGNNATQASLSINKDTVAPTVTITSPAALALINSSADVNGAATSVSGTCSENGQTVNLSGSGATGSATCSAGAFNATVNFTAVPTGLFTLTASTTDAAGNSGSGTRNFNKGISGTGTWIFGATGGAIRSYRLHSNGTLSDGAVTSVPHVGWDLAITPDHKFIYVGGNDAGTSKLYGFSVNGDTGALIAVPGSPFSLNVVGRVWGGTPGSMDVAIDPTGTHLYLTSWDDSKVTALSINSSTGALTQVAGSPYNVPLGAGNYPLGVHVAPSGNQVYLHSNAGMVFCYDRNTGSGALSYNASCEGADIGTNGWWAWGADISPDGNFYFTGTSQSSAVNTWRLNGATSTTYVGYYDSGNTVTQQGAVAAHPLGRHVYAAMLSPSVELAIFDVNRVSGALSKSLSNVTLSGAAVDLTTGMRFANQGQHLLVGSVPMVALAVNPITGALTETGRATNTGVLTGTVSGTYTRIIEPHLDLSTPIAYSPINSSNAASFTVSGNCLSANNVNISGAATASVACSGYTWTANLNLSGAADGYVTLNVNQLDTLGAPAPQFTRVFYKDTSAPSGGSIVIAGGATHTTSTAVTLTLAATSADEMYITNTAGCGSGGSWEPYQTSKAWTLGQTNTTATVYVRYRDYSGNTSSCVNDTIVHDNTLPTVAFNLPAANSYANASNYTAFAISGTCSENGRTVSISAGGGAVTASPTCTAGAWNVNLNLTPITDGAFTVTADHSDAAGNNATQASRNFNKDIGIPTVSVVSPAANTWCNANPSGGNLRCSTFQITGSCSENGQMVSVVAGGSVSNTVACIGNAWTWSPDLTSLADGNVAFTADLADAAGNNATQATRTFRKDTVNPLVTVTAPNGGGTWYIGTSQSITYTSSDALSGVSAATPATITIFYVDLSSSNMFAVDVSNTGSYGWTPDTASAQAKIQVIVKDAAGNQWYDESDTLFTVTNGVAPNAPTNFYGEALDGVVNLFWTASTLGVPAPTYEVYATHTPGTGYSLVGSPSGTSFSHSGVTNGRTYFYKVRAVNGSGNAETGEIAVTPHANPTLVMDFTRETVQPIVGTQSFNFTRTDSGFTATHYGPDGRLRFAPHNVILRSAEMDNASWTKSNSAVTANSIESPDGATAGDFLREDGNSGVTHEIYQNFTKPAEALPYLASIYFKAATRYSIRLKIEDVPGNARAEIDCDGRNGSNTAAWSNFNGFSHISGGIQPVGRGWYRCWVSTMTNTATSVRMSVSLLDGTLGSANMYPGNNTSGLYLWGAQIERNRTPSVYLATTTAVRYDGPRFDYDPVTKAHRGLRFEENSTNSFLRSEEFNNAAWTKNALNVTTNTATAVDPMGNQTAEDIIETTANSTHHLSYSVTAPTTPQQYAFSIFVRPAGRTYMQLTVQGSNTVNATFNLLTGAVESSNATGTATLNGAKTEALFSGWYRLTLAGTDANAGNLVAYAYLKQTAGGSTTYTGDGTSGATVWGAQFEMPDQAQGTTQLTGTNYIPTTTATVTRNNEKLEASGGLGAWYQSGGTWYVDWEMSPLSEQGANSMTLLRAHAGAQPDYRLIAKPGLYVGSDHYNSSRIYTSYYRQWVEGGILGTGRHKVAFTINAGDTVARLNGTTSGFLNPTQSFSVAPTTLVLGGNGPDNWEQFTGWIKEARFYKSRLANATLESMTSSAAAPGFADDFNDGSTSALWTSAYASGNCSWCDQGGPHNITMAETLGQLRLSQTMTGKNYDGYITTNTYNLTGASAEVQIIEPASYRSSDSTNSGCSQETQIFLVTGDSKSVGYGTSQFLQDTAYMALLAQIENPSYTWTPYTDTGNNYSSNPSLYRFFRVRHQSTGDTLLMEHSADGWNWTVFKAVARPAGLSVSAVRIALTTGRWCTDPEITSINPAYFDNFKTNGPQN